MTTVPVNPTAFQIQLRHFRTESDLTQQELGALLSVSSDYISQLELGKKKPSARLKKLLDVHLQNKAQPPPRFSKGAGYSGSAFDSKSDPGENRTSSGQLEAAQWIPVVGWAQAGIATAFEKIPEDWQDRLPITPTDPSAFAIRLRGDSMEPQFKDGDVAVVLPNIPVRHGDLVVANILEEGFAFKIFSLVGGDPSKISLRSYNPAYGPMDFSREQFHWIYPVDSIMKRIRR